MIKIYELLFEQDSTSTDTTSSTTSSTPSMDPAKLGDVVKKAVGDAIKEPLTSIQAYIKQSQKQQPNRPTPSNAEATTSTTGTKASGPSKPAGISGPSSPGGKEDDSKVADSISKNLTTNKDFLNNLAVKIKDSMDSKKK
jgi:hypothetical protein